MTRSVLPLLHIFVAARQRTQKAREEVLRSAHLQQHRASPIATFPRVPLVHNFWFLSMGPGLGVGVGEGGVIVISSVDHLALEVVRAGANVSKRRWKWTSLMVSLSGVAHIRGFSGAVSRSVLVTTRFGLGMVLRAGGDWGGGAVECGCGGDADGG